MYADLNDKVLIKAMKCGDEKAFRLLMKKYLSYLYNLCLTSTQQPFVAEEIVQDVFVRLWNNRTSLQTEGSLKAYLWTCCKNQIFDYWKKEAKRQGIERETLNEQNDKGTDTEFDMVFAEYQILVQEAVQLLPPKRKKIFQLCNMEGKTYEEVAKQFGLHRSTIHDHMVKSIRFIKEYLQFSSGISLFILININFL